MAALSQSNADWICAFCLPLNLLARSKITYLTLTLFFTTAGQDSTDNSTYLYTYTFNVCKNVISPPPLCSAVGPAAAYQWSPSLSVCYPLSSDLSVTPLPTPAPWAPSLLDTMDPSYGFNLTYTGVGAPGACQRSLHLIFRCGYEPFRAASATADLNRLVVEVADCHYEAYSWTQAGCPKECPIGGNGGLCSNLGICSFDKNIQQPRCFCDVRGGGRVPRFCCLLCV